MKKIIAATIIALATSGAFAAVENHAITKDGMNSMENPVVRWAIDNDPSKVIEIENFSGGGLPLYVQITLDSARAMGEKPDPVIVVCSGKEKVVTAASSLICAISHGDNAQIKVKPDQIKNGTSGFYAIISK